MAYARSLELKLCSGVIIVAEGQFRLRIRYGKLGRLRFLSHLEVIRALERSIRRAALPYAVTQGFNPHMKIAFGPALPVGTSGEDEYFDVWLTTYLPARELNDKFASACPPDLTPLDARFVSDALPSLTAALTISRYRVILGADNRIDVAAAFEALIRKGEITFVRKGKEKHLDLGVLICEPPIVSPISEEDAKRLGLSREALEVCFATRSSNAGALRPEIFLDAVAENLGHGLCVRDLARTDQFSEGEGGVLIRAL